MIAAALRASLARALAHLRWRQVIFAHWPEVDAAAVAEADRLGLELQRFEGRSWTSLVALKHAGPAPGWLLDVRRATDLRAVPDRVARDAGARPSLDAVHVRATARRPELVPCTASAFTS